MKQIDNVMKVLFAVMSRVDRRTGRDITATVRYEWSIPIETHTPTLKIALHTTG